MQFTYFVSEVFVPASRDGHICVCFCVDVSESDKIFLDASVRCNFPMDFYLLAVV